MSRCTCWVAVLTMLAASCSDSADPPNGQSSPSDSTAQGNSDLQKSATTNNNGNEDLPVPVETTRSSPLGRWLLTASQLQADGGQDAQLAIVEISRGDDNSYQAKVLYSSPAIFPGATLQSSEITDQTVGFVLAVGGGELNFEGLFDKGVIRGNSPVSGEQLLPMQLTATEDTEFSQEQEIRTAGGNEFLAAVSSDEPLVALKQFLQSHGESPMAIAACEQIIRIAKPQNLDEAAVKQSAADYYKLAARWGPRMEQMAHVKVGSILARQKYLPDLVIEVLEEIESKLTDDDSAALKKLVTFTKATALVETDDEGRQKQGAEIIRQMLEEDPLNHIFRFAMAEYTENHGNADDALELYAGLVVLPDVEALLIREWRAAGVENTLPSETVTRLWKEKHGNSDGLDAWLDVAFKSVVHQIVKKPDETSESLGNRVALVELFTGSKCPPCVAADLAAAALEATWPMSHLIVLRYHEHVPGPDPLSNADSEARFGYYDGRGTPTVSLNGKLVEGVGGYVIHSQMVYDSLRQQVAPELVQKTDISLELSATAKDGKLSLSAQVGGLKEISENLRLRLVLAEDEVSYQARNGIRLHEMLVRIMPTGPEGVSQDNGELKFAQTIELSQLKKKLIDYLSVYEGQYIQHGIPSLFPVKPLELDKLHLVAFVQDDQTREILQAAAIPVAGKLEYPAGPVEAPLPDFGTKPAVKPGVQDSDGPKLISPGTGSK